MTANIELINEADYLETWRQQGAESLEDRPRDPTYRRYACTVHSFVDDLVYPTLWIDPRYREFVSYTDPAGLPIRCSEVVAYPHLYREIAERRRECSRGRGRTHAHVVVEHCAATGVRVVKDGCKELLAHLCEDGDRALLVTEVSGDDWSGSFVDMARILFHRAVETADSIASVKALLDELCRRGNGFMAGKRCDEAVACYSRVLACDRDHIDGNYGLGFGLLNVGQFEAAITCFQRVLRRDINHAGAHRRLGEAYRAMEELEAAADSFRRALELHPADADSHFNLGTVLNMLDRPDEAIACHRRALDLEPEHAPALSDMGVAWTRRHRADEALKCHRRAIALKPDWAGAHSNLGVTLLRQQELEPAIEAFERAIKLAPDNPILHRNLNSVFLLAGDFDRAWRTYKLDRRSKRNRYSDRFWDGEPLEGRTILLHADDGLGDTLQMVRFVPEVAARGGRVILEVQKQLKPLLAGYENTIEVRCKNDEGACHYDVHASLFELPFILGCTLKTIPTRIPYLRAQPELVRAWAERVADQAGLKVGIVWRGNPQMTIGLHRSCLLTEFAPLAAIPGVNLLSLQRGAGTEQLAESAERCSVIDFSGELDENSGPFMDTAALMESLDLVVTVDTSICHLAGGLGRPVWVLLPHWVDWRWMLGRDDSPWYPTMRLFRQPIPGNWTSVFAEVATALGELTNRSSAARENRDLAAPSSDSIDHVAIDTDNGRKCSGVDCRESTDRVNAHHHRVPAP